MKLRIQATVIAVLCCSLAAAQEKASEAGKKGAEGKQILDCSDPKKNTVPCYIAEVRKIVKKYRSEVREQVEKQESLYVKVAGRAAQGRRDEIDIELRSERTQRSERLAAAFTEGRTPYSKWRDALLEYADIDGKRTRGLFDQDTTSGSELLAGIESLKFDASKADALDKLMAQIAKPDSLADRIAQLRKFAGETKTEFDKKVCAGLKSELAAKAKEVEALEKAVKALPPASPDLAAKQKALKEGTDAKTALEKRRATKGCKD